MVFTKEDKVVIKFLRETKRYGAKRFLSEFPTKLLSRSGLKRLIKKIDDSGSASNKETTFTLAWEELDQRIIDTAVQEWRTGLHACVKAKGDHFEHKLPWLNDEMLDKLFSSSILTIGFYYDFRISDQMRR